MISRMWLRCPIFVNGCFIATSLAEIIPALANEEMRKAMPAGDECSDDELLDDRASLLQWVSASAQPTHSRGASLTGEQFSAGHHSAATQDGSRSHSFFSK